MVGIFTTRKPHDHPCHDTHKHATRTGTPSGAACWPPTRASPRCRSWHAPPPAWCTSCGTGSRSRTRWSTATGAAWAPTCCRARACAGRGGGQRRGEDERHARGRGERGRGTARARGDSSDVGPVAFETVWSTWGAQKSGKRKRLDLETGKLSVGGHLQKKARPRHRELTARKYFLLGHTGTFSYH